MSHYRVHVHGTQAKVRPLDQHVYGAFSLMSQLQKWTYGNGDAPSLVATTTDCVKPLIYGKVQAFTHTNSDIAKQYPSTRVHLSTCPVLIALKISKQVMHIVHVVAPNELLDHPHPIYLTLFTCRMTFLYYLFLWWSECLGNLWDEATRMTCKYHLTFFLMFPFSLSSAFLFVPPSSFFFSRLMLTSFPNQQVLVLMILASLQVASAEAGCDKTFYI